MNEPVIATVGQQPEPSGNVVMGAVGGLVAAAVGAFIWMEVTVQLEMHLGLVAIGIGALVGFAIRYLGQGSSMIFGVMGALLTLLGCLVGEVLAVVQEIATKNGSDFFTTLGQADLGRIISLILENTSGMGYIIYAIALYEGFKLSMKKG